MCLVVLKTKRWKREANWTLKFTIFSKSLWQGKFISIDWFSYIYVLVLSSILCLNLCYCNDYRITKLEELGNAANTFLLRFQQGLCTFLTLYCLHFYHIPLSLWHLFLSPGLLKRSPMLTSSTLIKNLIKSNETRRLKSYIDSGCINIDDAAKSTKACKWSTLLILCESFIFINILLTHFSIFCSPKLPE